MKELGGGLIYGFIGFGGRCLLPFSRLGLPFIHGPTSSKWICLVHPFLVLWHIFVFCSQYIPIISRSSGENTVQLDAVTELSQHFLIS